MPESSINAKEWQAWEVDPSTRDSLHLWTKWAPVDVTLSTAGTAENLYTIDPGSPVVNLATNPSFETGAPPTGYTLVGSALSQSNTIARNGTFSLLINPDNAAVGEGAYWTSQSIGTGNENGLLLVASVYFNDNVDSGSDARIVIADSSGTTLANGNTVTLSSSWQRSVAAYRLPLHSAAQYRVYFVTVSQHNTNFYVDSFLPELKSNQFASDYCDGSLGLLYEWDGTAHASISRRRGGLQTVRGYTFHTTGDIYISYDVTASSTTGRYVRAGTDFWLDHPVDIFRNISFINVNVGETPRVYGEVWGVHTGGHR